MGVEFMLFDTKGRRAFDLGKGGWAALPVAKEAHTAPQDTLNALLRCWERTCRATEHLSDKDIAYMRSLAPRVWAFFQTSGPVHMHNDDYDDEACADDFVTIASRCRDDDNVRPDPLAEDFARYVNIAEAALAGPNAT